jgi:glycosyltransferase involved in cell wall biosynthesis
MIAYRLTDRLADISTNVSAEAVQAFIDQGALRPGRMIAIHNGINVEAFTFDGGARRRLRDEWRLRDTDNMLLAVGRLGEQKDFPGLLSALARLKSRGYHPRLLIVGEGPERKKLAALAASLGIDSQVEFVGVRHDVPDLMTACDVFVLSSAWEGFGLVVAEAMACERVVVATDSGGVREVVGEVGLLVPPRDSNALAEALEHALALPRSKRDELGRLGRERVIERYSLQATASRYLSVFEGLSPEAGRSSARE